MILDIVQKRKIDSKKKTNRKQKQKGKKKNCVTCLVDKMNCGSQEKNQLLYTTSLDGLTHLFHEHYSIQGLTRPCIQHSYCVPSPCNFIHLYLIAIGKTQNAWLIKETKKKNLSNSVKKIAKPQSLWSNSKRKNQENNKKKKNAIFMIKLEQKGPSK